MQFQKHSNDIKMFFGLDQLLWTKIENKTRRNKVSMIRRKACSNILREVWDEWKFYHLKHKKLVKSLESLEHRVLRDSLHSSLMKIKAQSVFAKIT